MRHLPVMVTRAAAVISLTILVGGCVPDAIGPGASAASSQAPGLTGVLVDESGRPIAYRNVMACTQAVCFYSHADGDGRFTFLLDEPIRGVIKSDEDLRSTPRRTSPMLPIAVAANEYLDVGDVVVPSLPEGTPVDPNASETRTLDAGDGLSLTVSPARIETGPGRVLEDIAARRLPEHAIPGYASLAGGPVIAVYALHPFAAKSSSPMPLWIVSDLPTGVRVHLRTIDEVDGTFSEPVPAVVRDGMIATLPGEGITSLTHLVVVGETAEPPD